MCIDTHLYIYYMYVHIHIYMYTEIHVYGEINLLIVLEQRRENFFTSLLCPSRCHNSKK